MEKDKDVKILILCSFYSTYVTQLCKYMWKFYPCVKYSLLTHESAVAEYQIGRASCRERV